MSVISFSLPHFWIRNNPGIHSREQRSRLPCEVKSCGRGGRDQSALLSAPRTAASSFNYFHRLCFDHC